MPEDVQLISGSVSHALQRMAAERLAYLKTLDFAALEFVAKEPVQIRGRWRVRGVLWTERDVMEDGSVRIAVLQTATVWWWPSYLHFVEGFRIDRAGGKSPLTQEDIWELD